MKKIFFAALAAILMISCDGLDTDLETRMAPQTVEPVVSYDTATVAVEHNVFKCFVYRIERYQNGRVDTTTYENVMRCEFSGVPSWEREVEDFAFSHKSSALEATGEGRSPLDSNWSEVVREYNYTSKNSNIAEEENAMPYSGKVTACIFDNGEVRYVFTCDPVVSDISTTVTVDGDKALLVNTINVAFKGFNTELSDSIRLNKVVEIPEEVVPQVETGTVKSVYQTVARTADRQSYVYTLSLHYVDGSVMPVAISSETLEVIATGANEANGDSRYNGGCYVSGNLVNCVATDQADGMVWASSSDKIFDSFGFVSAVKKTWDTTQSGRSVKTNRFNLQIENGILTVRDTVSGKLIGSWK